MLAFLAFKENSHPTIEIWLYYGFVPRCYASLVFSEAWPNLDRQSIFLVVSSGHLNSFGNHDISQTSLVIGKLCKFLPYNDFFFAVNLSTQNYL